MLTKFLLPRDCTASAIRNLCYKIKQYDKKEIEKALNDLNGLVLQGKSLDAFEKYYHDEVSMQENSIPPTTGKRRIIKEKWNSMAISLTSGEPR